MRYLLNSAVITAPGRYEYRLIDADEARLWFRAIGKYKPFRCPECKGVFAFGSGHFLDLDADGHGRTACGGDMPHGASSVRIDPAVSTIGYAETAEALAQLLGAPVAVDRRTITMDQGDEALVFRLAFPPGTPRINPQDKGAMGAAVLAGHYELGLLARLPDMS